MAFDTFMKLGDIKGESVSNKENTPLEHISTATVQLGENNLGQVASRLGFHKDDLLAANPHIKDPSNLKVGQEIQLPPHPTPKDEGSAASQSAELHSNELPKAPVGDPLEAGLIKHSLEMASKSARLGADNAKIGADITEAGQKFENATDAARTEMVLGATQGAVGGAGATGVVGDIAAVMFEYQKIANKEARADRQEQRDEKVLQEAKAISNTPLSNVDVEIKELLNQIENKRRSEDQTKDTAKNGEEAMDSVDSQLQKAAQSYEQAMGAITGNSGDPQGTTTPNGESEMKARNQAVFPDRH